MTKKPVGGRKRRSKRLKKKHWKQFLTVDCEWVYLHTSYGDATDIYPDNIEDFFVDFKDVKKKLQDFVEREMLFFTKEIKHGN